MKALHRMLPLALTVLALAAPLEAQAEGEHYTNLRVLPKDIPAEDLRAMMNGFTRSLGVRCVYCHVGEEGKPFAPGAFALDDKPAKQSARVMIQMTQDLNEKYLTLLPSHSTPPVRIDCFTCHHGATPPRKLQDVLQATYETAGLDSTLASYTALHDRYYGRAVYDFGDVPLVDLANHIRFSGHAADAQRLLETNLDAHPKSMFAKRQYALTAMTQAFETAGIDSGTAVYMRLKQSFGESIVSEELLNQAAYELLGAHKLEVAVGAFKLNVAEHPGSGNAYDSLGEAYVAMDQRKLALEAYTKSLALDPTNENAKSVIPTLKAKPRKAK